MEPNRVNCILRRRGRRRQQAACEKKNELSEKVPRVSRTVGLLSQRSPSFGCLAELTRRERKHATTGSATRQTPSGREHARTTIAPLMDSVKKKNVTQTSALCWELPKRSHHNLYPLSFVYVAPFRNFFSPLRWLSHSCCPSRIL